MNIFSYYLGLIGVMFWIDGRPAEICVGSLDQNIALWQKPLVELPHSLNDSPFQDNMNHILFFTTLHPIFPILPEHRMLRKIQGTVQYYILLSVINTVRFLQPSTPGKMDLGEGNCPDCTRSTKDVRSCRNPLPVWMKFNKWLRHECIKLHSIL